FRREIDIDGTSQLVFLEKLPRAVPEATIWKLNGQPSLFYLETSDEIRLLGKNYREQLGEVFQNPLLDPLLELMGKNDYSLDYLFHTAKTIKKPRTFSRIFVVTPYVGYSSQTVGLTVPDSNQAIEITGSSPAF